MTYEPRTVPGFFADAVATDGNRPFLIWRGLEYTYSEVSVEIDKAARMWLQVGVRKGDRVAFMLENRPQFLFGWLGLAKIGGILVAINTRFKSQEAKYLVGHSGARWALVDSDHYSVISEVASTDVGLSLDSVISVDPDGPFPVYDALVELANAPLPEIDLSPEDVISFIYTSGTTGLPKAVMQTHSNYVKTGEAYPTWVRLTSEDRSYMCLPLFHVNAQAYQTMGAIGARSSIVLAPRFSATKFWQDVVSNGVTVWNFVGAMMVIISKQPPSPTDGDNPIRIAYSGGGVSALSGEQRRAIENRYKLKLLGGFGMSETTFGFVDPYDAEIRPGSIGLPRQHPHLGVPRNRARIVDDSGQDVRQGDVGELLISNSVLALGYYNDPERTAEAFRDGWLHTGDLSRQDSEGFYYFVDRKKDIIRRRGENISSVEVERSLRGHPSVADAAVVAVPSEMMDEEALAFVVLRGDEAIDPESIWDRVNFELADFKVPRFIQFIDELPKTSTQKIEKAVLREMAKTNTLRRFERNMNPQARTASSKARGTNDLN